MEYKNPYSFFRFFFHFGLRHQIIPIELPILKDFLSDFITHEPLISEE